jgi:hypothetical protein
MSSRLGEEGRNLLRRRFEAACRSVGRSAVRDGSSAARPAAIAQTAAERNGTAAGARQHTARRRRVRGVEACVAGQAARAVLPPTGRTARIDGRGPSSMLAPCPPLAEGDQHFSSMRPSLKRYTYGLGCSPARPFPPPLRSDKRRRGGQAHTCICTQTLVRASRRIRTEGQARTCVFVRARRPRRPASVKSAQPRSMHQTAVPGASWQARRQCI